MIIATRRYTITHFDIHCRPHLCGLYIAFVCPYILHGCLPTLCNVRLVVLVRQHVKLQHLVHG